MSLRKKGRNFQSVSGKTFREPSYGAAEIDEYDFATVISKTLRNALGGSGAVIKTVMAYTGAGERAVKNWFEAKNGPNGENLIELVRHSDEVLEAFLMLSGREEILTAKKLVDARSTLFEMLELIDRLQTN